MNARPFSLSAIISAYKNGYNSAAAYSANRTNTIPNTIFPETLLQLNACLNVLISFVPSYMVMSSTLRLKSHLIKSAIGAPIIVKKSPTAAG